MPGLASSFCIDQVLRRAQFALKNKLEDADVGEEPAAAPKAKARGRPKGRGKAKAKANSVAPEPVAAEEAADEPDQDGQISEVAELMDKTLKLDASSEKPEKVPTDMDCGDAGDSVPLKPEKRPKRKQASASKAASASQAESVGNEDLVKPKRKRAKKAEVSGTGGDENALPAAAPEVEDALPTSAPSKATRKRKASADKGHEKKEKGHEKKEVRSTKGAAKDSSKEGKSKEKKDTHTFARRVQPRSKFGMAKWSALRRAFVQFIKPAVPFPSKHEDIWDKGAPLLWLHRFYARNSPLPSSFWLWRLIPSNLFAHGLKVDDSDGSDRLLSTWPWGLHFPNCFFAFRTRQHAVPAQCKL